MALNPPPGSRTTASVSLTSDPDSASPPEVNSPSSLDSPQPSEYSPYFPCSLAPPQLVHAPPPLLAIHSFPFHTHSSNTPPTTEDSRAPLRLQIPWISHPKSMGIDWSPHDASPLDDIPSSASSSADPSPSICLVHPIPLTAQLRSCLLDHTTSYEGYNKRPLAPHQLSSHDSEEHRYIYEETENSPLADSPLVDSPLVDYPTHPGVLALGHPIFLGDALSGFDGLQQLSYYPTPHHVDELYQRYCLQAEYESPTCYPSFVEGYYSY
ncbi:hypothetical protein DFH09DRAFT_996475 [Mycena vulgaris]|nr:hypothetical protein DFH09DRAFT_996475 [Mycena vulgaris]